eukprot:101888_1
MNEVHITAVNHAPSLHTHHMRTTCFGKVPIMEGDGELPSHVLILQDNKQKQKSKELLLRQQRQLKELSKLLLPSGGNENNRNNNDTANDFVKEESVS